MKKIIYSMMALAISATVFTSCEDVPSPYNMTFEEPNVTPTPQPTTDLNTEATAWTVAEAVQKIQAGQTTNGEAYVKGIISAVTFYDQNHKSLSYYISDNGTDKTLQVFSGKGVNGADFAAKTDLQVGQTVVVKGNLKAFTNKQGQTIMEIDKGSKIITIGGSATPQPSGVALAATFATGEDNFTINNITLPSELTFVWKHDAKNKYMKASAHKGSDNYASESRLVSPAFSLAVRTSATLSFKHAAKFFANAANEFKVQVSTDGTTWHDVAVSAYPTGTDWKFIDATCDLSAYAGQPTVYIGFHYTSTATTAGTWEISNVEVK